MVLGQPCLELARSLGCRQTNVDRLFILGKIERQAFSLYLNAQEAQTGSIVLGGLDSSKCTDDLITSAMTPKATGAYDRFRLSLTGMTFKGVGAQTTINSNTSTLVILDSGATAMYLPDGIAQSIYGGLGAMDVQGGYFTNCACRNSRVTLAFQFAGSTGLPLSYFNASSNNTIATSSGVGLPGVSSTATGTATLLQISSPTLTSSSGVVTGSETLTGSSTTSSSFQCLKAPIQLRFPWR